MRPIINIFKQLLFPAAQSFQTALENPLQAQQSVQKDIVNRLAKSEYGKFLGIQSVADWNRIPIVEYHDIKKWLEGKKAEKTSLLTPERIMFYEKTSGSRTAAKLIPYPKSLRASFNYMFCVWAHDLLVNGPAFSTGKIYFCISPQLAPTNIGGVPIGLEDDSEYLDGWLKLFLSPFLVFPPGLNKLRDAEEFKHKLSQALLLEEKLEIISIWSPSFLKVHLDYIQNNRIRLSDEIGDKMSDERSKMLLEPKIPWTQLWRELKLISCWDSANAADGAGCLRSLFPGVTVQGKGLLATEAPMTIPLIAAGGCVPVLNEVFFEFEDQHSKIKKLHEIEMGNQYEIILSQKGGLYRYRIGDRVRVSHFYKQTPCLEFLGRKETISDLVGEKLHEDFVRDVINNLALEGTFFKSLVPAKKPIEHYILLLDSARSDPSAIANRLDAALQQSPQYQYARKLGQLSQARVLVSSRIPEIVTNYKMRSRMKWGDIKHQILVTNPLDDQLLTELSNF